MRFCLIFMFVHACLITFSQDERSLYLWNKTSISYEINDNESLRLTVKSHYDAKEEIRDMTYLDMRYSRSLNNWFNLGVGFRGAQSLKKEGTVNEYRPQLLSKITFADKRINMYSSNRYEYRFLDTSEDQARYCHNLFVHFPAFFNKLPQPYFGEELYVNLNQIGFQLFRIYGGLHIWENDWLQLDVYYVLQKANVQAAWDSIDVIGMNMEFSI